MLNPSQVGTWVESMPVQRFIIVLIIANAVTLGLETSPAVMAHFAAELRAFDTLVLAVFVLEIGAKLFAFSAELFPQCLESVRLRHRCSRADSDQRSADSIARPARIASAAADLERTEVAFCGGSITARGAGHLVHCPR